MTQCESILNYMYSNGGISAMDAFRWLGVTSLHRRISDLKKQGYSIEIEPHKIKNRYGKMVTFNKYSLCEVENDGTSRL